jgi:hypothetical protein
LAIGAFTGKKRRKGVDNRGKCAGHNAGSIEEIKVQKNPPLAIEKKAYQRGFWPKKFSRPVYRVTAEK